MLKKLKKWMVWRMAIALCLLPLAETAAQAQRGMKRPPASPRPVIRPAAKPPVRPPVILPPVRPSGIKPPPAMPMAMPDYPGAAMIPIPVVVPRPRPPRDLREFSDQVSASPIGGLASALGSAKLILLAWFVGHQGCQRTTVKLIWVAATALAVIEPTYRQLHWRAGGGRG